MKALILKAPKHLVYEDVPPPAAGPEDVLVRVRACGICGSDVHGFDGSTGRRLPPIIMGHEAAGVIAEVGPRVTGWAVGDRVTFDSTVYCGTCFFCRAGRVNLCDNRRVLGVSCGEYRQHGAFAEFVAVPQHILYRLPEGLSFERAAMVEALSVAVHAVSRAEVGPRDAVVVVGAGMIGLLVVQALRAAGCGRIMAVDVDASRLALAVKFGADDGLRPADCDVPAEVRRRTDGRGADVAIEAVGLPATVQAAAACVRKGGRVALVGNLAASAEFPLQAIVTRELVLAGSCASAGEYPQCLDLMATGRVNVDPLMSAVAPLADGAAWFDRLYRKEPGLMKVILQP